MLGGEDHVGRAEEGVRAGGEDFDGVVGAFDREFHERAFAAADPVFLEELDAFRPVEAVEALDEPLGECGDAEHPLAERAALDGESADLALAINDLLVGENGAELRAPVHGHLGDICEADGVGVGAGVGRNGFGFFRLRIEPGIVELEENPLGPAEVFRVGGGDLAVPIVAEADGLELAAEVVDVAGSGGSRVLAGFDGELFGRQAKGVPAHGVQDIEPAHAVEAGEDVGGCVAFDMADMQAVAAGVGEHIEDVVFRFRGVEAGVAGIGGAEGTGREPIALPAGFEFGKGKLFALRGHG